MEIKKKIALQFTGIVALLLAASLLVIYLLFASFRKDDFKERLSIKALSIAQLITETVRLEPELIKRIEKNNPTSLPNENIIVFNDKNDIIFSSGFNSENNISEDLIVQIRNSKFIYQKNGIFELTGHYYKGNTENVVTVCCAHDVFGFKKLKNLKVILISVFFFSIILIYILGKIFAIRALLPLSGLIQQINIIDSTNLRQRLTAGSGKDEISLLADTFNNMLERLETAFKTQKEFIANASHELRTPLTAITGNLEVALLKERTNEEYKQSLYLTLEEVKKLNHLINRLLTLLRTGTAICDTTFSEVRIDDVLWKARSEHLKKNKKHSVQINFDSSIQEEQSFQYKGNAELLKTAFLNIIDNACKYSSNKQVEIKLSLKDGCLLIYFKDSGIGIPENELDKIFQPFFRASNVKKRKGHGIGMSLVERIIAIHKGEIHITSQINKGTTISLYFPL